MDRLLSKKKISNFTPAGTNKKYRPWSNSKWLKKSSDDMHIVKYMDNPAARATMNPTAELGAADREVVTYWD
jgi:hypothetical protein